MCGSGTVLAVARAHGHLAFGIDCDPLAVLSSKVWTSAINARTILDKADEVLRRARRRCRLTPSRHAYPSTADDETRKFIDYWYDRNSRRELFALSECVSRIRNETTRRTLWCAFSRMIVAKKNGVSLAMDLAHSRPHRVRSSAPVRPFDQFVAAATYVVRNCLVRGRRGIGPKPEVRHGDNRRLPFNRETFDLVITSPPYLNAIDYLRCSKFSLVWMGHTIGELRTIRSNSVGAERGLDLEDLSDPVRKTVSCMGDVNLLQDRQRRVLARYVLDMQSSVTEVARVLKDGGRAVYVVGNNQLGDVFISNSNAVRAVATNAGMKLESEYVRELPPNRRYLPPPSSSGVGKNLESRMRKEVVLQFAKRDGGISRRCNE